MDTNASDLKNQNEKHISLDYKSRNKTNTASSNIDKYRVTASQGDYRVHGDEANTPYCLSQRISSSTITSASPSGLTYQINNSSNGGGNSEWDTTPGGHTTSGLTAAVSAALSSSNDAATRCDHADQQAIVGDGYYSSGNVLSTAVYLHNRTAIIMDVEDGRTSTADHLLHAVIGTEELGLTKSVASQVFALWTKSPLLEVQLKPHHVPFEIHKNWQNLIARYSHTSINRQSRDDPIISFQRNVFYCQQMEEKIKDQRVLEMLYEECRYNILHGRYPCEVAHYIMLGGIQARIELGPYNPQLHSTHYFREEQFKYLPVHVRKSDTWTWLPISGKNSAEVRLLEQFKRIPNSATNRKLIRKYLEFCWSLPFYGAAFFEGQVEQPVRGLTSLMTHQDTPVLVAINARGVYVIDDTNCTVLIGLNYEDMNWDFARPDTASAKATNPNCLPCLFLQFAIVENGARVSKILQVFSKQAKLMDILIAGFVQQHKEKSVSSLSADENVDRRSNMPPPATAANSAPQSNNDDTCQQSSLTIAAGNIVNTAQLASLSNKLNRLTLATFDENGHCIGQMGSWSFSY